MSLRFTAPKDCVSEKRLPFAPEGRYGHRSILFDDRMLFFGGYNGSQRLSDIYEYNIFTEKWREIKTRGISPRPRDCHSCVLFENKMVVFGGGTGYQWMNDLFEFHIPSRTWKRRSQKGSIPHGRAGHSAVVFEDKMYVFGGWNGFKTMNDLHCLNLKTRKWREIHGSGRIPEARDSHCSVVQDGKMMIVGGGDGHRRLRDMYKFDFETENWTKINHGGFGFVGRAGHFVASYTSGNQLIMFGGGDGSQWIRNIYRFDSSTCMWNILDLQDCSNSIPGCYGCSGAIYRNMLVLFGGGDGANFYNTLYTVNLEKEIESKTCKKMFTSVLVRKKGFVDCVIRCCDDTRDESEFEKIRNKNFEDVISTCEIDVEIIETDSASSNSDTDDL